MLCATEALRRAGRELPDGALLFLNVAPQTLDRDARGDWLIGAIAEAGIALERVVVEVTARVGPRGAAVAAAIARLREHGLRVAIDDVGSGTSGLEMLRRTHPDFVKIDRSVVAAAADTDTDARAALDLVKTLGERVGAGLRVDGGQGFGLGRPDPYMPTALAPPDPVLAA